MKSLLKILLLLFSIVLLSGCGQTLYQNPEFINNSSELVTTQNQDVIVSQSDASDLASNIKAAGGVVGSIMCPLAVAQSAAVAVDPLPQPPRLCRIYCELPPKGPPVTVLSGSAINSNLIIYRGPC